MPILNDKEPFCEYWNMRIDDLLKRLEALSEMISNGSATSPKVVAKAMGVSPRTIISYVNLLRQYGQQIWWCRKNQKYMCSKKGRLIIRFVPEEELKHGKFNQ